MSKLFSRAKICLEHAKTDYNNLEKEDCYLDSSCFHLQQCIEFILKGIVELHGLSYAENHDIRANLNILYKNEIKIPYEKELRNKANTLYGWETESRYKESFIAAIQDIEEVISYADGLMAYITSLISKEVITEIEFPDKRL